MVKLKRCFAILILDDPQRMFRKILWKMLFSRFSIKTNNDSPGKEEHS